MRLYLMRHAMAVPLGSTAASRDAERPLTEEGLEQARRVARGLQRLDLEIDLVASSPWTRALQTAEQVGRVLGPRIPLQRLDALRGDARLADTSAALSALKRHRRLLLVGHEPHLSAWLAELVAGQEGCRCLLKKGGVACIEVDRVPPAAGRGTLRWLMTPKQLTAIGLAP